MRFYIVFFLFSILWIAPSRADTGAWKNLNAPEKASMKNDVSQKGTAYYWCIKPYRPYCLESASGPFDNELDEGKCERGLDVYKKDLDEYVQCVEKAFKKEKDDLDKAMECRKEGKKFCY